MLSVSHSDGGSMTTPRDPLERFFTSTLRMSHLRTLGALARYGQVRRVAEAFHVTQSAISKQIAEIEVGLGEAVARREGNALVLTPIGQRLAARANDILQQLERTRHEIATLRSGLSGRVVVGAVSTVNVWLVPQAIGLLRSRAPGVVIAIEEDSAHRLLPRLLDRSIDLAVIRVWQPVAPPGLSHRMLMDEELCVAVGSQHRLAGRRRLSWDEAMDHPWIVPRAGTNAHGALSALLGIHGHRIPDEAVESVSVALNAALLSRGAFIGLLPRYMASDLAAQGRIAVLPLDTGRLLSEIRVFWRTGDEDPAQALVLDCLAEASRARPA
jgi:DNA-binding transcriptional LysR family regulator